jgi:hypothetical protein
MSVDIEGRANVKPLILLQHPLLGSIRFVVTELPHMAACSSRLQ